MLFLPSLTGLTLGLAHFPFTLSQSTSSVAHILVYSATAAFRHDSIPTAIEALKASESANHISFDSTEDKGRFTDDVLSGFDAVVMLMNTGEGACG